MASSFTYKLLFITALLVLTKANARPLDHQPKSQSLVARLKLDKESPNCWDSLFQLQACTGEVILFFLNGETYLGHECCQAIHTIGHQCWPTMINTIGFTTEEGDILQGYCEHESDDDGEDGGDHSTPLKKAMSIGSTKIVP